MNTPSTSSNGPPSTDLLNPIKEVRLRHGLSQRAVGELSGMSAQAVMRYEQGLYENLSASLAGVLADLDDRATFEVLQEYWDYREAKQIRANLTVTPPLRLTKGEHPFESFRHDVMVSKGLEPSRIKFCILLALHPATVAEYDSGRVSGMPALIHRGLLNAGMNHEALDTLVTFGELWYDRHSA